MCGYHTQLILPLTTQRRFAFEGRISVRNEEIFKKKYSVDGHIMLPLWFSLNSSKSQLMLASREHQPEVYYSNEI